ncbi:SRPBCC family protein [Faecalibacter bovis]|uniref:SRPBCC family protein n=1 Tax=Faecalibacter bovis TaxID=2898187 RepID=A0ABX7XCV7_9FLAO|nr:SRPBCC family protein [Faecalibacter bovis]QTV05733.1 SRPBCC family protein [Faecalibacter bovis]
MKHHLKYEQYINASMDEVWAFFSDAKNLTVLTPDHMKMKVRTNLPDTKLFEGMRIAYTVSPLFGIPVFWETEIVEVSNHSHFVDIQLKGPFKSWKHTHTFLRQGDGVLMVDEIEYELPFGVIGNLFHESLVLKNLEELFIYRKDICQKIFLK